MTINSSINNEFYNNSILLDIFTSPNDNNNLQEIVNKICLTLYPELDLPKTGKDRASYDNHLEQIIYNLIVSVITSRPIAYSRDRNNYGGNERYAKIQYSYTFLIKLIDKLHNLGFINHIKGIFYTNNRKVSRFWPALKFVNLVKDSILTMPIKTLDVEPIRLHAKKNHKNDKKLRGYSDNGHHDTIDMRNEVNLINQTLNDADIKLEISDDIIDANFLKKINDNSIFSNILAVNSSNICYRIIRSVTTNMIDNFNDRSILSAYSYENYNISMKPENENIQYVYNLFSVKNADNKGSYEPQKLIFMTEKLLKTSIGKKCCEYYWVNNLDITFHNKRYHRVFNENFDHGGRFYNAQLQQIPRHLRKYLTINGNKTIELDYSAQHLRMLYHMKGIDYRDDPYAALIDQSDLNYDYMDDILYISPNEKEIELITKKTGLFPNVEIFTKYRRFKNMSERSKYKISQLILINAMAKFDKTGKELSGKDVAIRAIMGELIDGGVSNVKREMVEELIDKFERIHHPIKEYLYSGIALKLQNLDSKIMNEILVSLAQHGIPALSYHDSIRVEEQHEALLRRLMMDVYKKHVGFYPVI